MDADDCWARAGTVRIRLLGPVELACGTRPVPVTGRRQLRVVAALALEAGRVLSTAGLIASLWADEPPRTAARQLQTSVWMIRRALASVGAPQCVVRSTPAGYLLDPAHYELDSDRFRHAVLTARELQRDGRLAQARARVDEGLALWRGPALGAAAGAGLQPRARRLEEERVFALEQRAGLDLALGRHETAIGELLDLIAQHPLREAAYADLMLALYRSGRQSDALAVYRRAQRVLADELAVRPGPRLAGLERAILRQDESLLAGAAVP
ncbi:AfsR/SARP family transcriptional regulator [Streptantibioticus cattleyicolor]|uniref:Transcriptional regulator ccaR-like protein n=2 Tax=Streptantibioticus cattleyicolor TaxID=29303 RepID=F8JNE8_STREN|nr:AfsR/SARP family transcriptional regulator [Streptantibioticus cattleyicolor]AEW99088.1 transcriptional regulator ccaR-like protein [Streptantibioticus cattleyicolor NRRL 8057 = DSM 46488]CAD18989.1 transcriptional regulator ccaR homologue [Streptantibioticus cattleyicolor]CCB71866.1 Transcriptional regulator [Streptantibioticus cattleyicolor NRRL 8057 = DSM 46488]